MKHSAMLISPACATTPGRATRETLPAEHAMHEGHATMPDGVRLFYRRSQGAGQPLVLPNGMHLLPDILRLGEGRPLIVYDPRNRGRSDRVVREGVAEGSISRDVEDLEALRAQVGTERIDLLAHSYAALIVVLYALQHPGRVGRLVLVSPIEPSPGKEYPPELRHADDVAAQVFARMGELRANSQPEDPVERCERFWAVMRRFFVANPAHGDRIDWGRCDLENERQFFRYWTESLFPSIRAVELSRERLAGVDAPTLVVHGRRDRSAPYGGARDWVALLPNARLVTIDEAGHAPWIEAPEIVYPAIEHFLTGG